MEKLRLGLFIALVFLLLLIWQAWQEDARIVAERNVTKQSSEIEQIRQLTKDRSAGQTTPAPGEDASAAAGVTVLVETDLLAVEIDSLGADIREIKLKKYPISMAPDAPPYPMLSSKPERGFFVETGLLASDKNTDAPNHHSLYQVAQTHYRMDDAAGTLAVEFHWQGDKTSVTKSWTFHRDSYLIDLTYSVTSEAGDWQGTLYGQLQKARGADAKRSFFQPVSYQGAALSTRETKYKKVSFDEMQNSPYKGATVDGWVAMLEHYFVAALIPDKGQSHQVFAKQTGTNQFAAGMVYDPGSVRPGETRTFKLRLYAGPKEQQRLGELEGIAENLVLTVDFGLLTALSQPLFWLLRWLEQLVGNWGISIVLVTILIKAAFYKLSAASYKSMAQLRKLNPKLTALRERYADDKQKLNQKMMEMYREEKINPLGGCLPILVQIPVFLALYWVLLESVELRQAPFLGWIKDLSTADPYYVLPLIMGISMLVQQRLSPAPLDPIQQKVMMVLPVVFTVFFALFPSGLVLYWVVNNLLSILQQWYIARTVGA